MRAAARAVATVAALLIASSTAARADDADRGFTIGAQPVWFVMAGLNAGATVDDDRGALIGGELSVVRVRNAGFAGIYADAYYDFGLDGTILTGGPELGFVRRSRDFPVGFGIDGGAAVRFGGGTDLGATGRVFVSFFGAASLYARYLYLDADGGADHAVQVGVTLKFPLLAPMGAGALD